MYAICISSSSMTVWSSPSVIFMVLQSSFIDLKSSSTFFLSSTPIATTYWSLSASATAKNIGCCSAKPASIGSSITALALACSAGDRLFRLSCICVCSSLLSFRAPFSARLFKSAFTTTGASIGIALAFSLPLLHDAVMSTMATSAIIIEITFFILLITFWVREYNTCGNYQNPPTLKKVAVI